MSKKYEVTNEKIEFYGRTLYRIKALKDFGNVKKGDLGGCVESESNLSQKGNCWVYKDANVFQDALVYDNAWVGGIAKVYGKSQVYGNAEVTGNAEVYDNARVRGNARISAYAQVHENASIFQDAQVYGNAEVTGNAEVSGYATVNNHTIVSGDAKIYGYTLITGDAIVKSVHDYSVFKNSWSSGRYFTYTKSNKMWTVGCFYGTGLELIAKAYKDSKESGDRYKATVQYAELVMN